MNAPAQRLTLLSRVTTAVCRLLIAAAGINWWFAGDRLSFSVAAAALAITFIPARLVRDLPLRAAISVVLAVLLAAHVLLGMQADWYESSAIYDKSVHFVGSGAVTALLIVAILRYRDRSGADMPPTFCLLLALGGAVSAGTLWELFEFAMDLTGLFTAQRGLRDTMLDLLADAAGAGLVTAAVAAFQYLR